MAKLFLPALLLVGLSWGSVAAAAAQDCQAAYRGGDAIADQAIDGAGLSSPDDIRVAIGRAEGETVTIRGGDFSGWDFSGGLFPNVCFFDSDLSGSDWAGARASGVGFFDTDLTGARMAGAYMPDVLFRNPQLKDVDAGGADWTGGYLDGGWEGSLENLRLDGARLVGFTVDCGITIDDGCPLDRSGISARGADFSEAVLSSFNFYDLDFTGAIFDRAIVGPRQVSELGGAIVKDRVILEGGQRQVELSADEWATLRNAVVTAVEADAGPSFDCGKATGKVEQAICDPYASDMREADRQLARLYDNAKTIGTTTVAAQRAWLKRRNACAGEEFPGDCIRQAYEARIGELLGALGETEWLLPGRAALFVAETLETTAAFRATALYAKVEPVLIDAAMASILVERGRDGRYAVSGEAVAANAHLCSLDAANIVFDRRTGWYSVPHKADGREKRLPLFRYLDGRIAIWRDGRPDYDGPFGELLDYVSCGARASLPPMLRVHASDELIEQYRRNAEELRGR